MVWVEGIGEIEEEDELPIKIQPQTEVEYHDSLITVYQAFKEQVYDAQHVLHPSCAFDASPAKVFEDVTFVDLEKVKPCEGAMALFRKHGLKAFKMDIQDYHPKELHDLLILLNPAISTSRAIHAVKQGGFIITNDYHGNASEMHENPEMYELIETIKYTQTNRMKRDNKVAFSRDITDLFVPCDDFDEMARRRPSDYDFIKTSYPHLLKISGQDPGNTIEETYQRYTQMMNESDTLPSKRTADFYLFTKK